LLDKWDHNAWAWANKNGHTQVADLLRDHEEKQKPKILTKEEKRELDEYLLEAIKKNDISKVRSLINKREDINAPLAGLGINPLWLAVNIGLPELFEIIELLIQRGADVNLREEVVGATPLMSASMNGLTEIGELLIKNKANVNEKNYDGQSALHWACEQGHVDFVELLIENGADVNAKCIAGPQGALNDPFIGPLLIKSTFAGGTPLMSASFKGKEEVVLLLLQNKADPTLLNDHGESALDLAEKNGHTQVADLLKEYEDNINYKKWQRLNQDFLQAASEGNPSQVQQLLDQKANIYEQDSEGRSALMFACRNGDLQMVELLLSAHTDVHMRSNKNRNALFYAIESDNPQIVKLLLEHGIEMRAIDNESGKWYIDLAKSKGNSEIISLLQKRDDEIAASIRSEIKKIDLLELFKAVEDKDIERVQELMKRGVDVNAARDVEGRSPLMHACKNEDFEMVKILIEAGADVNAKSNMDKTPLMYAASRGKYNIVELLLEKGADVKAVDKETGQSAVYFARFRKHTKVADLLEQHLAETKPPLPSPKPAVGKRSELNAQLLRAASEGKVSVIEELLAKGANVNTSRADGSTPLMLALYCNRKDAAQLLIEKGADVNARDNVDWTPLLNALDSNLTELAVALIKKGADINAQSKDGKTPLLLARQKKNSEIEFLLQKMGAKEPPKPKLEAHEQERLNNRLLGAVTNGIMELTEEFLEEGVDVNTKFDSGKSLLITALEKGYRDIAKLLIENGADPNVTSDEGETPLMICLRLNMPDIARQLVDNGADVNAENAGGGTPLMYALKFNTTDIADYLVAKGAKGTIPRIHLFLKKRKTAAYVLALVASVSAVAHYNEDIQNFVVSLMDQNPVIEKQDNSWLIKIKLENARKALRNKNRSSFKHGIKILKQIPAKETIPMLLDLLKDKNPVTRRRSAYAIGVIAKENKDYEAFKPAIEPLTKLRNRSTHARRAIRIIQRLQKNKPKIKHNNPK
jgi:ankyrin repeat protein